MHAFWNKSLCLLLEFPFTHQTWKGSVSAAVTPFACSCLGVYSHFPWSVVSLYLFMITARSISIETIALLLEELNHSFGLELFLKPLISLSSDYLQEGEESRPPADWLALGGVGCEAGGRERGRAVKCDRNSWLKRGNGRYRASSIDTDRVGARLNCSSSRQDYGHRVVTPVPLLPQCGEATAVCGENMAFVQRSKGYLALVYTCF